MSGSSGSSGAGDQSLKAIIEGVVGNPEAIKKLAGVAGKLKLLAENPRRFVLGIFLSSLVGFLLAATRETIGVVRYVIGLPVPSQRYVCWKSSGTCDINSFIDIPSLLGNTLETGGRVTGTDWIAALEEINQVLYSATEPAGLFAPAVVVVIWGLVFALVWYSTKYGIKAVLILSPYP